MSDLDERSALADRIDELADRQVDLMTKFERIRAEMAETKWLED